MQCLQLNALQCHIKVVRTHLWFFLSSPQTESPQNQRRAPQDWPRWSGRTLVCIHVSVGQDSFSPLSIFTLTWNRFFLLSHVFVFHNIRKNLSSTVNTVEYMYYLHFILPTALEVHLDSYSWMLLGPRFPLFKNVVNCKDSLKVLYTTFAPFMQWWQWLSCKLSQLLIRNRN